VNIVHMTDAAELIAIDMFNAAQAAREPVTMPLVKRDSESTPGRLPPSARRPCCTNQVPKKLAADCQ
jgi:hypothetical protein